MRLWRWNVLLLLVAGVAFGGRLSFQQHLAMQESLRTIPPKMRMEWMHERGMPNPEVRVTSAGQTIADSGLRLVGKWGRGPAAEVTGKDSLVVLTLGSEVALLSFAKPDSPRVLSEIQFPSLTAQSYLKDSLLYTSSSSDLEVWNIANPAQPVKVGQLHDYPNEEWEYLFGGFWVRDTFLFYISRDTFHVISIANSADLPELGSCIDSGSVTTGSGNTVVVNQNGGYAFVDVSNPASPHQVGTYPCGRTSYFSAAARGNLVCASYEESGYPYATRFITLDISNPSSPRLLAKLNDLGGYGIFLDGPLAFVSGGDIGTEQRLPFQIISIADSAHPAFIDSCRTTYDYAWGVWENSTLNLAFEADKDDGLAVVDISNLNNPTLRTWMLKTGSAVDVHVDGSNCYVAGETDGFRLLDVTDPTQPVFLSGLDTSFTDASNYSVIARDSFAFGGWRNPYLRTVSVADPLHPLMVAACSVGAPPRAMELRDSLLYMARNNRFQIVNVARPREPVVVGDCGMVDGYQWGLALQDSFACLGSWEGLSIVNLANPAAPFVVSQTSGTRVSTDGVAVRDTFAFVPSVYETLWVYSVANPAAPYPIASAPLGADNWGYDAAMFDDTFVFAGCKNSVVLVNVSDPANPRAVASYPAPSWVRRVFCSPPYLYACCTDGGVAIFETTAVGITESKLGESKRARMEPGVVRGVLNLEVGSRQNAAYRAELLDVSGRKVLDLHPGANDVRALAPGVYFVREVPAQAQAQAVRKIVLTR